MLKVDGGEGKFSFYIFPFFTMNKLFNSFLKVVCRYEPGRSSDACMLTVRNN
jgi:hypothetical protein